MGGFLPAPAAAGGIKQFCFIVSTFGSGSLSYSSDSRIGAAQFSRTGVGAWSIDVSALGLVPVSGNLVALATVLQSGDNTATAQCDGTTLSGDMTAAGAATDLICSVVLYAAG